MKGENSGNSICDCPLGRSAGAVDSLIGQIRAIFRDSGRGTEWNETYGVGNPAASPLIKRHLSAIRLEQSSSSVLVKRPPPLFVNKLICISRHINYKLANPKLSMI